jgi:undecaprenyl-diphosphatase
LNDYFLSLLLGIIEGLTEFLPVSSTAHLRLAEQLFQLPLHEPYWKMYTIVIQLGAILALPIYFWRRIMKFIKTFPQGEINDRNWLTHPLTLVMIAFVVTAGPAFLLTKKIGENLDRLQVMGAALLIGGAIMWAVDIMFVKPWVKRMEEMSLPQAVWIGACQILSAVFPGTSRSMSTIAGGQVSGMSRESALEFSFFLSMPTMIVATLFALLKAVHPGHAKTEPGIAAEQAFSPGHMTGSQWVILLIGFIVSFIVSLGVVAWFMNWVRKRGFTPFAVYRIIVGIAVLLWAKHAGLA